MLEHNETLRLIKEAQSGSQAAKTVLLEENSPLVKSIIRRYRNKGAEYEDLFQLGSMGLLKAISNFDATFGVQFSTYAVPMIAGEVKRFLRDDGAIKVSRQIKMTAGQINAFIDAAQKKDGHTPSVEELSAHFDMDPQELIFVMDSNKMPVSIYEKIDDQDEHAPSLLDKLSDNDRTDEIVDKLALRDFISNLPEKERTVILLRYFRDKTQSEIAQTLGVSQVQISRMETKILQQMRETFDVG